MNRAPSPVSTAVIVPARNEEHRIGACLAALARQGTTGLHVIVVTNDCTDGTVAAAELAAWHAGLSVSVLDCMLPPGAGVGAARRVGCARAIADHPRLAALLTTDADCVVADDWAARNLVHLANVDAVCGLVVPMASETGPLAGIDRRPAEMEARYEALVLQFYRRYRRHLGDHGGAAGASLAIRKDAYLAVGGFAAIACGEDRDLVRRFKAAGRAVRHAGDVVVHASCRLTGRVSGGMSDALRSRVERTAYLIDDGLPPATWLIAAARTGRLGQWPLRAGPGQRLRARDLAPQIALLQRTLATLCESEPTGRDPAAGQTPRGHRSAATAPSGRQGGPSSRDVAR